MHTQADEAGGDEDEEEEEEEEEDGEEDGAAEDEEDEEDEEDDEKEGMEEYTNYHQILGGDAEAYDDEVSAVLASIDLSYLVSITVAVAHIACSPRVLNRAPFTLLIFSCVWMLVRWCLMLRFSCGGRSFFFSGQEDDDEFKPPDAEPQDLEIADEDDADLEGADSVLGKHPLEDDDEGPSSSKR